MRKHSPIDDPWWRIRYGPAWRYLTARDYQGHIRSARVADPLIKEVARYLRLLELGGNCAAAAPRAFPNIASAFELQRNQSLTDNLRLMVLGGLHEAEILARTGVATADLRCWMRIFFDLNIQLDKLGWHITHIVTREVEAGNLRLANRLHLARCGGPRMARRLLDGPGMVPSDPHEYMRYVLTEAQIASAGLFLSPPESRQEMEKMLNLALKTALATAKKELDEKKRAARGDRDQRRHKLAERRVSVAELQAEAAAAEAAANVQSRADKEAQDRELKSWHQEQQAAVERRQLAERQARIEQSPLQQLQWAAPQVSGSPQVAPAVVATGSPASPLLSAAKKCPPARRPNTSPSLGRVIAQAADAPHAIAEPSSSLAPKCSERTDDHPSKHLCRAR